MKRIAVALALLCALAATPKAPSAPAATIGDWVLRTDQVDANMASGRFSAPDHVTLTRADGSIVTGDRANGNYKRKLATLFGHVSVHDTSGTFGLKSAQAAQSHGPATLTADQLVLDDAAHVYDAGGHVHYEQGDTTADAERAHLNDLTHHLDLSGKVHVVQGNRALDADTVTYDTQTGAGVAQGNVLMTFPGITPSIATPKPITVKGPKIP